MLLVSYAFPVQSDILEHLSRDSGCRGPIDSDTPDWTLAKTSGSELRIVFDEFNNGARTFYPGDDPHWETDRLRYWQTGNLGTILPLSLRNPKSMFLKVPPLVVRVRFLNLPSGHRSTWVMSGSTRRQASLFLTR